LRRLLTTALFALLFVTASWEELASAAPPPNHPDGNDKVEWKTGQWPRVSPWEAAGGVGATAAGLFLERTWSGVNFEDQWEVPILDPGVRYLIRGRDRRFTETLDGWSDIGWRMMALFPYVDIAATLAINRNFDVAGQMALIDFDALTWSGLTYLIASRATGRGRPYRQDCADPSDSTLTKSCDVPFDNRSFYGGHAAAAFTSAGLTCVHHQHLPLYGGGAIEDWACVWALSVATATGAFRIVADEHYASDILIGAGVGWFYGYIMPKLLHYRSAAKKEPERKAGQMRLAPSFEVLPEGGAFSIRATL
jgi:membrane-associated phospholipid phosphatase